MATKQVRPLQDCPDQNGVNNTALQKTQLESLEYQQGTDWEHELDAVLNSGNKNKRVAVFALAKPGVNLELFHESCGVKEPL